MQRSNHTRPIFLALLVTFLSLATGYAFQSTAFAARGAQVMGNATAADNGVIATVYVGTDPRQVCRGRVWHAGQSASLPALHTDDTGGGRWVWKVAHDVPAGEWNVKVSCKLASETVRSKAHFVASRGKPTPHKMKGLIAPGTMQAEGWHNKDAPCCELGGGGEENTYPPGQCTWWAKRKRPDLPIFLGPAGNAKNWAQSARHAKPPFAVGTRAKPGAVVVFQPGQAGAGENGHVAYVESVHGPEMTISEANYQDYEPGHHRTLRWVGEHFQFIYKREAGRSEEGPRPLETFRHYVFRTCLNGHCGLRRHVGPGSSYQAVGIPIADGSPVDIRCQEKGETVVGLDATSTDIWDQLANGSYASDYYVDTPGKNGQFSLPIPRCNEESEHQRPLEELVVGLTAPVNSSTLTGTATIAAKSNAKAVRFEALYSETPGKEGTDSWHVLGQDDTSADGFSVPWDTTGVVDQGLGVKATIEIAAVALTEAGTPTSVRDTRQVAVANPNSDGSFTYFVDCPGGCQMHRRAGPGFSAYPIVGETPNEAEVRIVCQVHGQPVAAELGETDIWDELDDGSWASDYYLTTPARGAFSPPIPECGSTPSPPTLEVHFTSPEGGATVTGTIPVEVSSNGSAVRFEAFYSTTPGVSESASWHALGKDSTPGDGFSVLWDTTAVPNQGEPIQETVRLRATALNFNGESGPQAIRRVSVSNPNEDGSFTYHVLCEGEEECSINLRSGPGYSSYSVVGTKNKGDKLEIACQAHGEEVSAEYSTDVWDELTDGRWISDYYVDTPVAGAFSPPIPECE